MRTRESDLSLNYETTGSIEGAVFHDGEEVLVHNDEYASSDRLPYETVCGTTGTTIESQRFERPPTAEEAKAIRIGDMSHMVIEGLRKKGLNQGDFELAGTE